jgi:hypothetical protein
MRPPLYEDGPVDRTIGMLCITGIYIVVYRRRYRGHALWGWGVTPFAPAAADLSLSHRRYASASGLVFS